MWKRRKLNAKQLPSGTIIVDINSEIKNQGVLIYARVSHAENKSNLDSQALRVEQYCIAKGYKIIAIVKEIE